MRNIIILFITVVSVAFKDQDSPYPLPGAKAPTYTIKHQRMPIVIDGNWNKKQWRRIKAVEVTDFIREIPNFRPRTEVKMSYDTANIYVIFRVHDRYVRCITKEPDGPVWKDAAVELFFCPDTTQPDQYFNLEINCGGTALLGYRSNKPDKEDISTIEIAHSLPQIVDPEIKEPVVWTLEYRLPLKTLSKYCHITRPQKGVTWKVNFCKIAENNSNPHYMTWSPIDAPNPSFHMPQFFGSVVFK